MPEPRDLPLFRWGAELRRARKARRRLALRAALGAAGTLLLGSTIAWPPAPRLAWNVSASAPTGLYLIEPGARIEAGDMVAAGVPTGLRTLAAGRGYLPSGVPLVKRAAAAAGERVCAVGEAILVGERLAARRLARDGKGRSMPWWTGCRVLEAGELLLLMEGTEASFDGRYFGVSGPGDVIGKATLLWRS